MTGSRIDFNFVLSKFPTEEQSRIALVQKVQKKAHKTPFDLESS
jgi:hypothetical protein